MDTIKLRQPLKVNGKDLTELPYDFDLITVDGFIQAESRARKRGSGDGLAINVAENDYSFQLYLGFEAVMAADPSIDITDLERLSGPDVMSVMRAGRFFILTSAGEDEGTEGSPESSSDAQSDGSRKSTAAASTK